MGAGVCPNISIYASEYSNWLVDGFLIIDVLECSLKQVSQLPSSLMLQMTNSPLQRLHTPLLIILAP
jgi:hypothetical protein